MLLIKKNSKSRPISDTSSDDLFSKIFQPHSHDPTFSMASVVYDGEHGSEEETNDQNVVAQRIDNANWQNVENVVPCRQVKISRCLQHWRTKFQEHLDCEVHI